LVTIQIYGVRLTVEDAMALAALGADHVGFDVWPNDEISLRQAREVVKCLPSSVVSVALPRSVEPEGIIKVAMQVKPDVVMTSAHLLEGPEDEGADTLAQVRKWMGDRGLMVGVAVPLAHGDPDWMPLERARRFEVYADFICLDTMIGDRIGETGQVHDWRVSRRIVQECRKSVILAGGLSPENVTQALEMVGPWGVDACTSLDVRPGKKDLTKVEAFIRRIRCWEGGHCLSHRCGN